MPRVRARGRRRAGTKIESPVGRYAARSPNRSQPRARRQRRFRQYSIPSPQPSPMRILFRFCCTTAATCGRPSPPWQRLSSLRAWCQGVRRICDVGPSGECWSPPDTQGEVSVGVHVSRGAMRFLSSRLFKLQIPGRTGRLLGSWWRPACAWWAYLAGRELEHEASRHRARWQSCLVCVSRRLASDAPTVYDRVSLGSGSPSAASAMTSSFCGGASADSRRRAAPAPPPKGDSPCWRLQWRKAA